MEARRYRLDPDYGSSSPIWDDDWDGERTLNPDPASLGLSPGLCEGLRAWQDEFERTLDQDDPTRSGFRSDAERDAFNQEGDRLLHAMQHELGEHVAVRLVPET